MDQGDSNVLSFKAMSEVGFNDVVTHIFHEVLIFPVSDIHACSDQHHVFTMQGGAQIRSRIRLKVSLFVCNGCDTSINVFLCCVSFDPCKSYRMSTLA